MTPETVSVLVGLLLGLQVALILLTIFMKRRSRPRTVLFDAAAGERFLQILPALIEMFKSRPTSTPAMGLRSMSGEPLTDPLTGAPVEFTEDADGRILCNRPNCKACAKVRQADEEEARESAPSA